jgi:hypothetical protein
LLYLPYLTPSPQVGVFTLRRCIIKYDVMYLYSPTSTTVLEMWFSF